MGGAIAITFRGAAQAGDAMQSSPRLLRKLKLYQTKARFYLVGCTEDKENYRIAKFSRLEVSVPGPLAQPLCTLASVQNVLQPCKLSICVAKPWKHILREAND